MIEIVENTLAILYIILHIFQFLTCLQALKLLTEAGPAHLDSMRILLG